MPMALLFLSFSPCSTRANPDIVWSRVLALSLFAPSLCCQKKKTREEKESSEREREEREREINPGSTNRFRLLFFPFLLSGHVACAPPRAPVVQAVYAGAGPPGRGAGLAAVRSWRAVSELRGDGFFLFSFFPSKGNERLMLSAVLAVASVLCSLV